MRRRIAGWAWLKGCDARDAYFIANMCNSFTPGVFQHRFGITGSFVTFACEGYDREGYDLCNVVAAEVSMLKTNVEERLPCGEVVVHDDLVD